VTQDLESSQVCGSHVQCQSRDLPGLSCSSAATLSTSLFIFCNRIRICEVEGSVLMYPNDQSIVNTSKCPWKSCPSRASPSYIDIRISKGGPINSPRICKAAEARLNLISNKLHEIYLLLVRLRFIPSKLHTVSLLLSVLAPDHETDACFLSRTPNVSACTEVIFVLVPSIFRLSDSIFGDFSRLMDVSG
jgi:hypothetical protein